MTEAEVKTVNGILDLFDGYTFTLDKGPLLTSCSVEDIDESTPYDDEVVYVGWESEGEEYNAKFTVENLLNGDWHDKTFICNDSFGEQTEINFFELTPVGLK